MVAWMIMVVMEHRSNKIRLVMASVIVVIMGCSECWVIGCMRSYK